ncbi:hypothetical protein K437DRAFT_219683 [Tilletiaria anomala UBC 951]|uniref:very-long-chain enoyl-CoA reductase n=1 Tax=Tilletiaria anomala (strain ATCC 24038 / CBS 436.72 / UBC 951) TaxID=1037660 RepID=A0A066WQU6_TILAU|nr:uncharacterized protein K437DRAFT_219683 [Tilletiaria anomala UBC 951]KDN53015.1 hypothetical protein K437DRAFT_219683 [Tilletiaria anomala UBC 951]
MTFKVTVVKRTSKKPTGRQSTSSVFPLTLELPTDSPTVADLKAAINDKVGYLSPSRQRLTNSDNKPLLDDDKQLNSGGVVPGDTIQLKDLGPQIAWKTVFLTEYFGPLFIHPLIYLYGPAIYGKNFQHSKMQQYVLVMVLAHYAKRELETLFVHRFSNATMPMFNIFKNSFHYWVLSGLLLAGGVYGPWSSASAVKGTIQAQDGFLNACVGVWAIAELCNLRCHMMLSNLRPKGTKQRKIPRGFAFELVSCPNYLFESIAWAAVTVMTLNPAALIFSAVSVGQMLIWALKKHRNYRKEFKDYPRGRKSMFPFIL